MKIVEYTKENESDIINQAKEVLENDGIIVYPTETVYGIGVKATSDKAVRKLLEYKGRREGKAISIAVPSKNEAEKYININDEASNLFDIFTPGPVTIIGESKGTVSKLIESEKGSLGVRIPGFEFTLNLLKSLDFPITATSANKSYKKKPYSINDFDLIDNRKNSFNSLVDFFIDFGELPHNQPSSVIDTTIEEAGNVKYLRVGEIIPKYFDEYVSNSLDDTRKFAHEFVSMKYTDTSKVYGFALQGEMGSGKTYFTKFVGEKLGIVRTINSPTFNIEKVYEFQNIKNGESSNLFHLDLWRIESIDELRKFNLDKRVKNGDIVVIEWAEKGVPYIKELKEMFNWDIYWLVFNQTGEETRKISFSNKFI